MYRNIRSAFPNIRSNVVHYKKNWLRKFQFTVIFIGLPSFATDLKKENLSAYLNTLAWERKVCKNPGIYTYMYHATQKMNYIQKGPPEISRTEQYAY